MAAFNKFNCFVQDLGRKVHNLDTDTLKVMLSNVAPVATHTTKANITEIAAGNGYTAGGHQLPNNVFSQTAGVAKLTGDSVVITASGGSIPSFRYAVLYNDTALNDELIGWWDQGVSQGLNAGEAVSLNLPDGPGEVLEIS